MSALEPPLPYDEAAAAGLLDEGRDPPPPSPNDDSEPSPSMNARPRDERGRELELVPASSIEMDRPRWVWDGRIPVGGTSLMPGREGQGKTLLACMLAAQITRGELPGEWLDRPGDVIYIGTEDDRETVLVPRLTAAGANLDRIMFVDMIDDSTFSISVDIDELVARASKRDVALIIVDPLDSHLGGLDSHKKAEVQAAVARLARAAQTLRCGALGLAHFNKAAVTDLLTKVVGSVGFTTSVRSVIAVGEHPDEPADRVCVLAKANMTDRGQVPAIRFRPEAASVDHPDGGKPISTARAVILEEIDGFDPNTILTAPADREDRSALEEASDWLRSMLSNGSVPKAEIVRLGRAEGHQERTLQRAREALRVVVERDESARGRPSTWALPDYVPTITCQTPLARNLEGPDQGKHNGQGGFMPTTTNGTKPPCGVCQAPSVAGSNLCLSCARSGELTADQLAEFDPDITARDAALATVTPISEPDR